MNIAIVGRRNHGKTTTAIELMHAFNLEHNIVNDFQKEGQYYEFRKKIIRYWVSRERYIKTIQSVRNTFCIIEEAKMYLPLRREIPEVVEALLSASHKERQNVFVMNFHNLRQIPEYILDYLDVIVLHHSYAHPNVFRDKFNDYPNVEEAFYRLKNKAWKYAREVVVL